MLVSFPAGGPWLRICRGWQLIEVSSTLTKVLAPANANGHSNFQLFSACPKWSNKGSLSFFCLFRKKKLSSEGLKKRAERKRDEAAPWGKLSRKAISSNRAAAVTAFS